MRRAYCKISKCRHCKVVSLEYIFILFLYQNVDNCTFKYKLIYNVFRYLLNFIFKLISYGITHFLWKFIQLNILQIAVTSTYHTSSPPTVTCDDLLNMALRKMGWSSYQCQKEQHVWQEFMPYGHKIIVMRQSFVEFWIKLFSP